MVFSEKGEVVGVPLRDYAKQGPLTPRGGSLFTDPKLLGYETARVRFAPDSSAAAWLVVPPSGGPCVGFVQTE